MNRVAEINLCLQVLNRRQFFSATAAFSVGCLTAQGDDANAAPMAKKFPPGKYIDVHVHIGTISVGNDEPLTVEQLLREMDARDVSQAWVLPLVSPEAFAEPVSTHYVLTATKPYRDRLIPFCVIDPRNSWYVRGREKTLLDQLKRYIDAGARGFGEHKPGIAIDDPRNMELYAGCAELNLPVLFHLDAKRNMDVPGLPGLEKVLATFPEIPFIGHAHGFWASISGSVKPIDLGKYPKTKIAPGGALDRLFDKYHNLYGDISSGSGSNALTRDPAFTIPFLKRRAERLLFGTDYLRQGWDTGQHDLFRRLALPADVQSKIFYQNARKIIS
jgi:predicted TIM-barrel fold metal-dependent hydrolase